MTKSQLTAIAGAVATALATLEARMDLLATVLPPKYAGWLRTAVIVGGVLLVLFNQSVNQGHIALPVEEAKRLGIDPTKHGGAA